jgi:acetylornithine aminotransferase
MKVRSINSLHGMTRSDTFFTAALKFARKYAMMTAKTQPGEKSGLVSFQNAFHGRTMGALSMTPAPKYQAPFAPLIPNVKVGAYNSTENLDTLIDSTTAGVIVEPIQGEGGIFAGNLDFLRALRKKCNEVGALLIFDEIQCGLFRSGTLWCHSEMPVDVHPDLITMAKPLANGFPIGAVLMRKTVADAITVGDHGTTFGGGPLTSRIAHHVLGRLSSKEITTNIASASAYLLQRLTAIRESFPDLVAHDEHKPSPRGRGLLIGMSMKEPSHAGMVVKLARERGLIVLSAGSDAVRIVPSLTVTSQQIDTACDILESCMLVLRNQTEGK